MLAHCKTATAAKTTSRPHSQVVWNGKPRPVKAWIAGEEPTLCDMLEDETMRRLMARDRVDPDSLISLVQSVRERLLAPAE